MSEKNREIGCVTGETLEKVFGIEPGELEVCEWNMMGRMLYMVYRSSEAEPVAPGACPGIVDLKPVMSEPTEGVLKMESIPAVPAPAVAGARVEMCETCRFWKDTNGMNWGRDRTGVCRKNPPDSRNGVQPGANSMGWCGEYRFDGTKETYEEWLAKQSEGEKLKS